MTREANAFAFEEVEPIEAPMEAWAWAQNIGMFVIGVVVIAT